MTSRDASEGEPAAFGRAVSADSFPGVLRTGWAVAALAAEIGRQGYLVEPNQANQDFLRNIHVCIPDTLRSAAARI